MSGEKHDPIALAQAYGLAGYSQSAAPVKEDVNSSVALARAYGLGGFIQSNDLAEGERDEVVDLARAYGLDGFAQANGPAEGERDAVVDLAQAYGLAGFATSATPAAARPLPSTSTAPEASIPVPSAAAAPTDGNEQAGSDSAAKSVPKKDTPSLNLVEPPLSQEAVETARTVLAAGGTVNDARVSLLRRASSDSAFRHSLAPSQSKRRNESYIGLEHRDAVFRAVDAAGASL